MKRRDFSAALGGFCALPAALQAQVQPERGPKEGRHFIRLAQTVPISAPAGKFDVIEFFWYGCPHCHAFDPAIEVWRRYLDPDIAFRRVPVAFRPEPFGLHQRLFYALDSLNALPVMHRKIFNAVHVERLQLNTEAALVDFVTKNGVDTAKFSAAFNSATVQAKQRLADELVEGYKIDGVPALGVHGRYFTSPTLAGTPDKALDVVDWLVKRLRKAK
jgi:protein dithiol oxidoreductase (disulfide-forming)